jgi:cobalt-zinc-cadmium efflux system protein
VSHSHHHHKDSISGLKIAFFLNAGFTTLEIFGGLWTNSIAIITDALHDSGDCLALGLAWYLQRLSAKGPDFKYTYGYGRFSTLGALVTGIILVVGLSLVCWTAIERLREPQEVKAFGMLGLAVLGILFNGAAAWNLRGGRSLNEKVASWHLIEDTLGWGAVLIGSAVMMIWDVPIIDPLLSLLISVFILWNVIGNLRKVLSVLLQHAPAWFDRAAFEASLSRVPGVVDSHHTHTWTLDGETHVLSMHLIMAKDSRRDQIVAAKNEFMNCCANRISSMYPSKSSSRANPAIWIKNRPPSSFIN